MGEQSIEEAWAALNQELRDASLTTWPAVTVSTVRHKAREFALAVLAEGTPPKHRNIIDKSPPTYEWRNELRARIEALGGKQ